MKEAIVCCVDTSHSMAQADGDLGRPRLECALEAVGKLVQSKMMTTPKDEVGVVLFGSATTQNQLAEQNPGQYEHVHVVQDLATSSVALARALPQVQSNGDAACPADMVDALVVALDLLYKRTNKKKYSRRILLITDAESPIANTGDLQPIAAQVAALEVTLMVIVTDFSGQAPVKVENVRMLNSMGRVLPLSRTLDLLSGFRAKSVAQTPTFRGALHVGPRTRIAVNAFARTMEAKAPTLSKESLAAGADHGKVTVDRAYFRQDDCDNEVARDDLCQAFRYGDVHVPCSEADMAALKYEVTKGLWVMGFTLARNVRRHWSVKNVELLIAEPGNDVAQVGLSALARACAQEGRVAIARYVKSTTTASLVMLSPVVSQAYEGFHIVVLPFSEDVRDYQFHNFYESHAPSAEQRAAADALVAAMDLDGDEELLQPDLTYNPTLQRLGQCTLARALAPGCPLPDVDPVILEYISQDAALVQRAEPALQAFAAACPLKAAVAGKAKKAKKRFWTDAAAAPSKKLARGGGGDDDDHQPLQLAASDQVSTVGSINPTADFQALLRRRHADATATAVAGMQTQILLQLQGGSRAWFKKAVGCLQALRDGCLANSEADEFNRFLRERKRDGRGWPAIAAAGITLISSAEEADVEDVSPEQAAAFLTSAASASEGAAGAGAAAAAAAQAEDGGDDMFADME